MKRIAYLISAYTEPKSFHKLIEALNEEYVDFYVHIDKKADIKPFMEGVKGLQNVFFVSDADRINVNWGGYSQIEEQYILIKYMLEKEIEYCRVVHLSGTDYPIVSNRELYNEFIDFDKEYIIGFDVNGEIYTKSSKSRYRMSNKFTRIYLMDSPEILKRIALKIRLKKLFDIGHAGYSFYFGSEYWALTLNCLRKIISSWEKDNKLQKILKTSYVPSEAWIHTVFFNSEYREKAVKPVVNRYELGLIELSPLTYFEYEDSIKILDENDFDTILASEKLFARKIIVGKSDKLIELIDKKRL